MRKLNKRKVRWIIREKQKGLLSNWQIAKQQRVSARWVNELFKRYLKTRTYPFPKVCGRTPVVVNSVTENLILDTYKEFPMGSTKMEMYLDTKKKHIPHNQIQTVLTKNGLAKPLGKKIYRKKWVRFERRYSNSLWHTDYCEIDGKQVITYEDDASRFITGHGEFTNATMENALIVLKKAIHKHGKPKAILNDNGTQFTSNEKKKSKKAPQPNAFQEYLAKQGIKQIKTRVKHPQTNGKQERVFGTIKRLKKHFGTIDKAIEAYNYKIFHLSLTTKKRIRTPYQAFKEKRRKTNGSRRKANKPIHPTKSKRGS
jgi:transposase InsO family protein